MHDSLVSDSALQYSTLVEYLISGAIQFGVGRTHSVSHENTNCDRGHMSEEGSQFYFSCENQGENAMCEVEFPDSS